jgi:hypothetical protein
MMSTNFVASSAGRPRGVAACLAIVCSLVLCAGRASATDADIVNAAGFESPAFTTTFNGTGQLEGQVNPVGFGQVISPGQWLRTQGTSVNQAIVQSAVAAPGGTQAVKVDRLANGGDTRWAVPVNSQGYPDYPNPAPPEPAQPFICISWDMRVEQASGPANTFGPFFGVEAYDDDGNPVSLLGSLGVDATTGDVLYQAAGTGFLTETGSIVTFGAWNKFAIELDYSTKMYSYFLNGAMLGTEGFVDEANVVGGLNQFSDADIATFAAAGDPGSLALTGTAYFDNFVAMEGQCIPEPTGLALGLLGIGSVVAGRRGRRS